MHLGRDVSVRNKETVLSVAVALAIALILFDIDINPELAMSRESQQLDAAQEYLDNLKSIDHNKAEAHALQGFVYSLRIGVDPANRGQKFSGMSGRELKKAEKIEPGNPRVLHLLAQLPTLGLQPFQGDL